MRCASLTPQTLRVSRLDTDHLKAALDERSIQPLRKRAGFDTDQRDRVPPAINALARDAGSPSDLPSQTDEPSASTMQTAVV
jgi:hypothetical protein